VGADDFDSAASPGAGPDGKSDLVFYDGGTGEVQFWLMNGTGRPGVPVPLTGGAVLPFEWRLAATGDFNHDGRPDLVWRNGISQKLVIWTMNGVQKTGNIIPSPDQAVDGNWGVVGAMDFNGDGHRDLLWYNASSGNLVVWTMDANVVRLSGFFTNPASAGGANWRPVAVGDYGRGGGPAGAPDIVWRNATSGKLVIWFMGLAGERKSGVFTTPDAPSDPLNAVVVGPR
jgi:hypothetical protein